MIFKLKRAEHETGDMVVICYDQLWSFASGAAPSPIKLSRYTVYARSHTTAV